MKKYSLLICFLFFSCSCKKTGRILFSGYIKDKESIQVYVNDQKVMDKLFESTESSRSSSGLKEFDQLGEGIDYEYFSNNLNFKIILSNEKIEIIDTVFNLNQNQLPFVVYFKAKKKTQKSKKFDTKNSDYIREIQLIKKDDEGFSEWNIFFTIQEMVPESFRPVKATFLKKAKDLGVQESVVY